MSRLINLENGTRPRILRFVRANAGFFWVFGVAVFCHLSFSRLGFYMTDGPIFMAMGRRIVLEGEIPHLDFLSPRPPLSYLMSSVALIAGDYAFYFGRFLFWLQSAAIAWFSAVVFTHRQFPLSGVCLMAAVAFIFNVHSFWTIQWATVDGLFFVSLGLYLLDPFSPKSRRSLQNGKRFWAFAIMGLAYLCKQNFILPVFASLFLPGAWRNLKNWFGAALPGVLYVAVIAAAGGFGDMWVQVATAGGGTLVHVFGVVAQQKVFLLCGLIAGVVVFAVRGGGLWQTPVQLSFLLLMAWLGTDFSDGGAWSINGVLESPPVPFPFFMLAVCFSISVAFAVLKDYMRASSFAWIATVGLALMISSGYATPFLFAGTMTAAVLTVVFGNTRRGIFNLFLIPFVLFFALVFANWRETSVYRSPLGRSLVYPLDGTVPGARMIKTNREKFSALADLRGVVSNLRAAGKHYAIVPWMPFWWAASEQANPLPVDLPTEPEFSWKPELANRFMDSLIQQRGKTAVIYVKYNMLEFPLRIRPSYHYEPHFLIYKALRRNFTKTGETRFYEIYE